MKRRQRLLQMPSSRSSNDQHHQQLTDTHPNHLFMIMALSVDCKFVGQLHLSLLYKHVDIAKSKNIDFCYESSGELSVRKFFS